MTAEIALLNKEAVALAADSAVSIQTASGTKILPSANKIFTLSKYHPVGAMIYGNAQLLDVPWELLIKSYRRQLGSNSFPQLENYADDLLRFIASSRSFFPKESQDQHFDAVVLGSYENVATTMVERAQQIIEQQGSVSHSEVKKIASDVIVSTHSAWASLPYPESVAVELPDKLQAEYSTRINEHIDRVFQKLPITKLLRQQLEQLAVFVVLKFPPTRHEGESGLVIAGYGERDVYPVLRSYRIDGVFADQVLQVPDRFHDVALRGASIVPFAQSEMVHTFMEGVDPIYQGVIERELVSVLSMYTETVTEGSGLKGAEAAAFRETLTKLNLTVSESFNDSAKAYRHENYALPAVRVTAVLPKDELAAMAESLVNLTVYRRRMSMAEETVGGPVDVAVISKGDGFIWIKRKHYFTPELNPQFLANYFREEKP